MLAVAKNRGPAGRAASRTIGVKQSAASGTGACGLTATRWIATKDVQLSAGLRAPSPRVGSYTELEAYPSFFSSKKAQFTWVRR